MAIKISDYDTAKLEHILKVYGDGTEYRFTLRSNLTFKIYKVDPITGNILFAFTDSKIQKWTLSTKDKIFIKPLSDNVHSIQSIKKELLLRTLEMNY